MAERKHTPGPWRVFRGNNGFVIGIGEATGEGIIDAGIGIWRGESGEAEANAHLVAAAPDMFEALEPFGEQARHHIADAPEWDDGSSVSLVVNIRDLRAVLAALSRAKGDT